MAGVLSIPLFVPNLAAIPTPMSQLLNDYSAVPPPEQRAHIVALRDRAFKHYPYPCLGRFRFLDLDLSAHPLYKSVIVPLFSAHTEDPHGPVLLDLGCCLAQDLRKLLLDVSPTLPPSPSLIHRVYGADLRPEFINVGYQLFKDEATLPRTQFITPADVLDVSPKNKLSALDGRVNVLHITAVFHLFDLQKQKQVARRCLKLLNRNGFDRSATAGGEGKGKQSGLILGSQIGNANPRELQSGLILGSQVGNVNPRERERQRPGAMRFRHDGESWKRMWEEVVEEDEWREVVKSLEVESRMEARSESSRERDKAVLPMEGGHALGTKGDREKFIGRVEEGFRWQVWSVWVEFC